MNKQIVDIYIFTLDLIEDLPVVGFFFATSNGSIFKRKSKPQSKCFFTFGKLLMSN